MIAIWGMGRYTPVAPAADEDALTMMLEAARGVDVQRVDRLGLASCSLPYARRVQAGLVATALGLPAQTFCLECTTSARAATEAIRALGTGLVLAADGPFAAAVLLEEVGSSSGCELSSALAPESTPLATIRAMQGALAEYPGLAYTPAGTTGVRDIQVDDYAEAAYLELVQVASAGLKADRLALNPPTARLGRLAAGALGYADPFLAPPAAGAAGPLLALFESLESLSLGQTVLLVSYGAGSAADALLVAKGGMR